MQSPASVNNPNSAVHYDISPKIFELILDKNMNYSSGVYTTKEEDLDNAQIIKMSRIAKVINLKQDEHILDIGCGWSGPALYFAENYSSRITGINLSPVQREYGLNWAKQRGLLDKIDIHVCDVANMDFQPESFDKIMFLESIIHMPNKDQIFRDCFRLLKPGGRLFIQESNYDKDSMASKYESDKGHQEFDVAFGHATAMLSVGHMISLMEEAGFIPLYVEEIGLDYVITLSQWLQNMDRHRDEIISISKQNYTMLRRYLMIALGSYRSRRTLCHQITIQKPY